MTFRRGTTPSQAQRLCTFMPNLRTDSDSMPGVNRFPTASGCSVRPLEVVHRRVEPVRLAILLAASWLLGSGAVSAQTLRGFDTQIFLPPAVEGTTFLIDRPQVPRHLSYVVGLSTNWARQTLTRSGDDAVVVPWVLQNDLLLALGLFEWMELGVAMPVIIAKTSESARVLDSTIPHDTTVRPGDARLSLKVPIVRGAFSLSGRMIVSLPSGSQDKFLGAGYWTLYPNLVAAYKIGALSLGAEAGYRLRQRVQLPGLEYDDELQFAFGAAYAVIKPLSLIAETQVRVGVGGSTLRSNEVPLEIDGGVRWHAVKGLTVDLGGGSGVLSGYGAPAGRVFAMLRYASERRPCVEGPEDFDGFQDGDFCADLDNDGDGLVDARDECRNDAEDKDGFLDEDGCPDIDNDADGVRDPQDRCPLTSEDRDGFEDDDGCPESDNDQDGIVDGNDQCPMEPEDLDKFQDEDGCPEPGPNQATITVTDTRILISERLYFDFDQDTIRSVSIPLLRQVARVIKELPEQKRIRIEGYTDSNGDAEYNRDLSYRRSRSVVEYLVAHGVPRQRLDYVGYGPAMPVANSDTPDGAALNRRVEFTIFETAAPKNEAPATPKKSKK